MTSQSVLNCDFLDPIYEYCRLRDGGYDCNMFSSCFIKTENPLYVLLKGLEEHKSFRGEPYCWNGIVTPTNVEGNSLYVTLTNEKEKRLEIWSLSAFIMGWLNNKRQFI